MFAYFRLNISWWELIKRTLKDTKSDGAQALAAQLAYYFFLALFPALLFLVALASLFPLQHVADDVVRVLGPFAPPEVTAIIRDQILRVANGNQGGLLSLGLLGAIWSSSAAMSAVIRAMNRAYDIRETRRGWKVQLTAILITIGLAIFIVISFTLVVTGPEIADWLARRFGLGTTFLVAWKVFQWPLVFLLVSTGMGLIYYFAPDAEQEWAWITPGSMLAAALWLVGSIGFRIYVQNFTNYEATYGAIGGMALLLLWFYLTGLVIVIGAEMNAEIEHAAPWSGTKAFAAVPGKKKKIGLAAWREYDRLRRAQLV